MKTAQAPKHFIDLLDTEEIVSLYKHFSGVTNVKLPDRQTAEIRLLNVAYGKLRPVVVQAMKDVSIPKDKINQYGEGFKMPLLAPHGPMKPEEFKKHAAALAGDRKPKEEGESSSAGGSGLRDTQAAVLLELRKMIPEGATGDDAARSCADVAERLSTNVNAVCRIAEQLAKKKLVNTEDDTTPEKKLVWITLTPEGRSLKLDQPEDVRLPAPKPGPKSNVTGLRIFKLVEGNPRREGTHGYRSFALIKNGMTREEYLAAGGRPNDLAWDIEHKYVVMRAEGEDAPPAPAPEPKKEEAPKKQAKQQTPKKGAKAKAKAKAAGKAK